MAIAIVLAPILMASWFALCPEYGNPECPKDTLEVIAAYRTAPTDLLQLFLAVSLVLPYIAPLGFIAIGRIAFNGSPWVASVGVMFGWLGSTLPWGVVFDQSTIYAAMAHIPSDSVFATLENEYGKSPYLAVAGVGWGLHLLAYLLLGVALLRRTGSRRWAGVALVIASVAMGPLAYGLHQNALQVGAYVLVAIACIPLAQAWIGGLQPSRQPISQVSAL